MRPKFVYVFRAEDKDGLLELGYNLIHADKCANTFVFENDPSLNSYLQHQQCEHSDDSERAIAYVMTDVLTF